MSDLYKFRKSGDGYVAHPTTWEQHAADRLVDGAAIGAAYLAGGVLNLGARGVRKLARSMRDRKAMQLIEEMNAAEEAGDFERMLEVTREMVRRWPQEDFGHCKTGYALAALGRTDEAIAAVNRAVELGMDEYEGHMIRAMAYGVGGHTGKAIQEFTALTHHPQSVEARAVGLMGRVDCLIELEDFDQALSDANAAVAALPDEDSYETRARVHHLRGDDEQCLADLRRAIRIAPDNPALLNARADKYEALGRTEEAETDRTAAAATQQAAPATPSPGSDTPQSIPASRSAPVSNADSASATGTSTRSDDDSIKPVIYISIGIGAVSFLLRLIGGSAAVVAIGLVAALGIALVAFVVWKINSTSS
ncbi:MAG TPA: tetratricopeptide repeat protein [Pseudonocardiaceae bacterium]|nr:tetratricopeptide repeat protein [Pseudonocardiaceae bacterium]